MTDSTANVDQRVCCINLNFQEIPFWEMNGLLFDHNVTISKFIIFFYFSLTIMLFKHNYVIYGHPLVPFILIVDDRWS